MPPMPASYDTAQICINGHMVNSSSVRRPHHNAAFCPKCGSATITACPHCNGAIRGRLYYDDDPGSLNVPVPAFCQACGKAFPWTASAIETARLLADETDSLSPAEREELKSTFGDLVRDTPKTILAITRFNKLMVKAGKGAAHAFRDILVDIASETAKKAIFGP
jgi:hypothetical protein